MLENSGGTADHIGMARPEYLKFFGCLGRAFLLTTRLYE
jgi:hypothetical protein